MDALDFNALAAMTDKQLQDLFGIRDHFTYELAVSALAAAGTFTSSFTVQTDSNFLWQAAAVQADTTGTVANRPLITVTITDASSGRQLQSAASPVGNIFGTNELPFILPTPRFFRGGTQVTLSGTNYSAGTTYTNVRFSFIGTKFFRFAQAI
jgi:hypothetical protein